MKMGQEEVINLLKKERKYLTAKQISKKLNCTPQSLNEQLKSLVKFRRIEKTPKKIILGTSTYKRKVNHFKYKPVRRRK